MYFFLTCKFSLQVSLHWWFPISILPLNLQSLTFPGWPENTFGMLAGMCTVSQFLCSDSPFPVQLQKQRYKFIIFIYIFFMSISPHQKYRKCKSQLPMTCAHPTNETTFPCRRPRDCNPRAALSLGNHSIHFKSSAPDWSNPGPNTKLADPMLNHHTIDIPHYKGWCYDQTLTGNQKEMRSYQEKTFTNLNGGAPWGTNFFMLLQTKNILWRSYAKWNLHLQWAIKRKELRVPFKMISGIWWMRIIFLKKQCFSSGLIWLPYHTGGGSQAAPQHRIVASKWLCGCTVSNATGSG